MDNVYKKKARQSIIFCLIFFSVFLSSKAVISKMTALEKEEVYLEEENDKFISGDFPKKEDKEPIIQVSTVNNETTVNNDSNTLNYSSFMDESYPMLINNQGMYYTVKNDDKMSLYFTENTKPDSESILIKNSNRFKNFNQYGSWLVYIENNNDKVDVISAYNHSTSESISFDRELDKHLMSTINSMIVKNDTIYYTNNTDKYIYKINIESKLQSKIDTGLSNFSDLWILSVDSQRVETYSSYGVLETIIDSGETTKLIETDNVLYGIMYKDSLEAKTFYLLNSTLKGKIVEMINEGKTEKLYKDSNISNFLLLGDYKIVMIDGTEEVYKDSNNILTTNETKTGYLSYTYKDELYKTNGLGKPQKLSFKVD